MVLWKRSWRKHLAQFQGILFEMITIRHPGKLSAIAAERKSSMLLLPYGIPLTIGAISYFAWTGMLM
jgi:prepilin peptidase CpaA